MDVDFLSDPELASSSTDTNTQLILLHATNHDLEALKPLLRVPGNASLQDPETGLTPLHAAIAACGPAKSNSGHTVTSKDILAAAEETNGHSNSNGKGNVEFGEGEEVNLEKAKATVKELFLSGAIWNDLDNNDETPGCLAWRLGQKELYELCVEAGVRAEMLLDLMGDYEPLAGDSEEEEEEEREEREEREEEEDMDAQVQGKATEAVEDREEEAHEAKEPQDSEAPSAKPHNDINPSTYLSATLTFAPDKLLDADSNGVMMAWETDIMRKSAELLLAPFSSSTSTSPHPTGPRILNIGFGMGIIDTIFHDSKPKPNTHHIVEAHPSVLEAMARATPPSPLAPFNPTVFPTLCPAGPNTEASELSGSYTIHPGRWQDVLPNLLTTGQTYDAIYFDTFSEPYSSLKLFFTEYIPGLLSAAGRFSFFNGMGADRRVCYDVYCRKVEMDLYDAGLEVEWVDVEVDLEGTGLGLAKEGEGEWKGVRRRYWTLERYRLPVCRFLG